MEFKTVMGRNTEITVVQKSKFIADLSSVKDEPDAEKFIGEIRAKYPDASHHCFAYLFKKSGVAKASDDKEPHGTAGLPILEALKNAEIFDVCVVVTRYFGGTLLGTGGLLRAYRESANAVIASAEIKTKKHAAFFEIKTGYSGFNSIEHIILKHNAILTDKKFTDEVVVNGYIESEKFDVFSEELINNSGEKAEINKISEKYNFF